MWILLLTILLGAVLLHRIEGFSSIDSVPSSEDPRAFSEPPVLQNRSDSIWDRHQLEATVPIELEIRYPNSFQADLTAAELLKKLHTIFQRKCFPAFQEKDWGAVENTADQRVEDAYLAFIEWFQQKIGEIQVIHDRPIGYRKSKRGDGGLLILIEVLLYRVPSFHGKVIEMWVYTDMNKGFYIITIKYKGVVFEDQIQFSELFVS